MVDGRRVSGDGLRSPEGRVVDWRVDERNDVKYVFTSYYSFNFLFSLFGRVLLGIHCLSSLLSA